MGAEGGGRVGSPFPRSGRGMETGTTRINFNDYAYISISYYHHVYYIFEDSNY